MKSLLTDVIQATKEAGAAIIQYYNSSYHVEDKSPDNPVTEADYAANTVLQNKLNALLPEAGWLSEESIDQPERLKRNNVWVVDPLDGTKDFILGIPEFSVSVALVEDGQPILGVIYNPVKDEVFYGLRQGGVFLNGNPIKVSGRQQLKGARLDASRSEFKRGEFSDFEDLFRIQMMGSTAYKLARVAAGRCDASWSRGPKNEWDICAGVLLVTEAGGCCVDLSNRPFTFNAANTLVNGFIADNGRLHNLIVDTLAPFGAVRT